MQQLSVSEQLTSLFRQVSPKVRALLADALRAEVAEAPRLAAVLDVLEAVQTELGDFAIDPQAELRKLLFSPLEPFLVAHAGTEKTRGLISRDGAERIIGWIEAHGAPDIMAELRGFHFASLHEKPQQTALAQTRERLGQHLGALVAATESGRPRAKLAAQIGYDNGVDDLEDVAIILQSHQFLSRFAAEPLHAVASDEQARHARPRIERVAAAHRELLPFALVLTRHQMAGAASFVRIAAESSDGGPPEEHIVGGVIDIAVAEAAAAVRAARRTRAAAGPDLQAAIRDFGGAARALATEIDLVPDGAHARRLAALRTEFAESIRSQLQDIVPRIRRLVRPRAEERPNERPDNEEMRRLQNDVETLLAARGFAEEIAINAFTGRACREIRDMLDGSTPLLIERMRGESGKARAAIRARLDVVTRLSASIYGRDFAATLHKQIEVASQDTTRSQARSA